jgi:hypothetical protein
MHIDIEIEEVEEDHIETSYDESADDETYRMSPKQTSQNSIEEDEDNGSELRHESAAEEEEEGWLKRLSTPDLAEGILLILVPPSMSLTSLCGML